MMLKKNGSTWFRINLDGAGKLNEKLNSKTQSRKLSGQNSNKLQYSKLNFQNPYYKNPDILIFVNWNLLAI